MENKTMKQILNRASVVFAFVLMFFSLSAFADIFDVGFEAGKQFCSDNPNACGIPAADPNAITLAGKDAGKQECRDNPSACNINKQDPNAITQAGKDAGKQECRDNPSACGITQQDPNAITQAGKNAGKQECRDNPSACGITQQDPNAITQAGKNAGKQECRDNPSACGITQQDPNAITQAGKDAGKQECINNPSACGIAVNNNLTLQNEAKLFCQKNSEKCGVTEEVLDVLRNEGKDKCKKDPKTCFTQINKNPNNDLVPEDFCDNTKTNKKNCYSDKFGLYLNGVVHENKPLDELGNVNTLLSDITMDVLFNDKDTFLFMMKTEYLDKKLEEQTKKNIKVKSKPLEEINATEESNNFSQNITKTVITIEEQKQLITSNNAIETANKIDYYPTNVISSSEEDKPIQLNISKIGAGEVISYPNGIACGEDCQENYPINYPVELFAVPIDSNVSLKQWQGDCEGKTNHITVIMDANKTCSAVFE
jgi:general stress protein YciG